MYDKRRQCSIIALVTLDLSGNILAANQRFLELVGYSEKELYGNHIEKVMNNGSRFFFHSMIYPKIRMEHQVTEAYLLLQTKEKELLTVMFNAQLFEEEMIIDCFILQDKQRMEHLKEIRAINEALEVALKEKIMLHEELVHANQKMKRYAELDFLTGLYNRRMFIKKLKQMHQVFSEQDRVFSICIFDIDYFKKVNDQYGHLTGDAVLAGIAEEMRRFFDDSCILARFGGEEFILLLPDLDKNRSIAMIEEFRKHIKCQKWQGVSVSISFGLQTINYPSELDDIIIQADQALYAAKRLGRDQVVHRGEMDESVS